MSKTLSSQLKSLNYSFNLVSGLDTLSIKAGYSEYQGLVFFLDTFVNFSIMPSMVQEMQEMQDFAQLLEVGMFEKQSRYGPIQLSGGQNITVSTFNLV